MTTKDIKIISLGTNVKFGDENQYTGKITAVTIRDTHITYEISYWKNEEFKTIWLYESDFKTKKVEKTAIGFVDEKIT